MKYLTSFLALVACAVASLALVLTLRGEPLGGHQTPPANDPELPAAVRALEREIAQLRAAPIAASAPAPTERQSVDSEAAQRQALVEQRLTRLEAQLAQLALAAPAKEPLPQLTPEQAAARDAAQRLAAADVGTLQSQFADPRRTEEERLQALRELRGRGAGARTGAAADAAIRLVQTSADAKVRADVWRQMHGAGDARLVPHLLTSLQMDADRTVREKAAETLGDYLDQPGVRDALRIAADQDQDLRVRQRALQALAGGR